MILILDNYDSFTYNLQDYVMQSGKECITIRSNTYSYELHDSLKPEGIIFSPGPGTPYQYPVMNKVLKKYSESTPILGICLGFQAISLFYGGQIEKSDLPFHGKTSRINHNGHISYNRIPESISVTRYHSLFIKNIDEKNLEITAKSENGLIMSIAHKKDPVWGFQYHPEAILTQNGLQIIKNWTDFVTDF